MTKIVFKYGARMMNTWSPYGYSREVATVIALEKAQELAARFVGDWDISIIAA